MAVVAGFLSMSLAPIGGPVAAADGSVVDDPASSVNPLIGTTAGIDTFPGPDMPFGMMQWGPDTSPDRPDGGGYDYRDSRISGFSLTHLSGPGCRAAGDVPLLPVTGVLPPDPGAATSGFRHGHERTDIGYYRVTDDSGVTTELTTATRAGLARFTFPAGTDSHLLLKLAGGATQVDGTRAHVVGDREVTGAVESGHFCGRDNRYTLHFDIRFDHPITGHGTWGTDNGTTADRSADPRGMYLTFDTTTEQTVTAAVGISYTSDTGAARNLEHEVRGHAFAQLRQASHDAWNHILNRIRVGGGTRDQQVMFYTALYHALLHPNVFSDVDGRYAGMDGRTHALASRQRAQYANYSGWDIYRSQVQLLAMAAPRVASDIVTSMLNGYDQTGLLPKWAQNNGESYVMAGDPADAIIAGIYAFGARDFDTRHALDAMVHEATAPSNNRPGESVRDTLGYLPADETGWSCCHFYGPVSTQLEYDSADYAIASMAKALGRNDLYQRFATRAQDWRNIFNPHTGYIQAKLTDRQFAPGFTPATSYGFIEGTSAQYTPMIPFNLKALITARGGAQTYSAYLDSLFTSLTHPSAISADLSNEPSLEIPWEYNYTAQPWKTQALIRRIQQTLYSNTPAGAFGNDDLGEMSSWYVFSALGMYPETPGTDTLVLASPAFPTIHIDLPHDHPLHINAPTASPDTPYVQKLRINNQPWDKSWLTFRALRDSQTLDYTLDNRPHPEWASSPGSEPPSDNADQ